MELEATIVQKRRSLPNIAMHNQSRKVTKSKPEIRIIHIFAPEIIKADVSNFRQIVQNLTGKQDHHHHHDLHHQKDLKRNSKSRVSHGHDDDRHQVHDMNKSHGFSTNSEVEDEEEEMVSVTWNGSGGESSGGFLNSLGTFDDFIQELGEFPYLPLTIDPAVASSSHLHGGVFAESHQFS
ncbi:VQ motif-containing protein 17 [Cardamine amara subsp. amara]|uniref:VQ motif-containing protein 17 n=1 Tax=Cardamine amara subsp. amara TaxID=228776 RepID=A0ABD1B4P2_CARAN